MEYEQGTNPQLADTDGDGLSDGEELTYGEDGFVTAPLSKDTDGDQIPDDEDGQPLDAGSSKEVEKPGEPLGNPAQLSRDVLDRI